MLDAKGLIGLYRVDLHTRQRARIAERLMQRSGSDDVALDALLHVLNEEGDPDIRRTIVEFLARERPPMAARALAKSMLDPDPEVRARAAGGVAGYSDPLVLSPTLSACGYALTDPLTRQTSERTIQLVTGQPSSKITPDQWEQVREGTHPSAIWRDHFASLASQSTGRPDPRRSVSGSDAFSRDP